MWRSAKSIRDAGVIWQIGAWCGTYRKLGKRSALYKAKRKIGKGTCQAGAPFQVIKRQSGYVKVRFRGLAKNTAQLVTLFAPSNLWMVRKQLLGYERDAPIKRRNQGKTLVSG
ncbi:hypothetical protein GCM10027514_08750 [Azotobacter armeniacus]